MTSTKTKHLTLDRFLVQRQQQCAGASGELTRVLTQLGVVAKIIASSIRRASLEGLLGHTGETNVQGEQVNKLDTMGDQAFVEAFEYVDIVGALVSEEDAEPRLLSCDGSGSKYVVLVDPIDGSSNLDVDGVVGSIFSIRELHGCAVTESVLQQGTVQVAAGYLMFGPAVLLLYTAGDGVHSFVLDEEIGEFVLAHESMTMPENGKIISANFGNYGKWTGPVRKFADTATSGQPHQYTLRYSGALVADLHQILHQGGLYFYPEEENKPQGKLRLMYECAPMAMIAEQAGGGATTGKQRILDVQPDHIHQRVPFAIGSQREIRAYEEAHQKP